MNSRTLILYPNGDIEIVADYKTSYKVVYHKSYDMGDNLKQNLINAYEWIEKKENKEKEENE